MPIEKVRKIKPPFKVMEFKQSDWPIVIMVFIHQLWLRVKNEPKSKRFRIELEMWSMRYIKAKQK